MNRKHRKIVRDDHVQRRGSTLVIVIALLGLLAFTGIVFYTFAAQEKASSQFFSEAAKAQILEVDGVFDWGLRQILVGADENERNSILYSPTDRFSILRNQFGNDISPHNGPGVSVRYQGGVPVMDIDQDSDGFADYGGLDADYLPTDPKNLLEMVDSLAAWGFDPNQDNANQELSNLFRMRGFLNGAMPAPDVDYTYPDINNMFLAYRGYAIRDNAEDVNGNGTLDPGEDRNSNGALDVPTPRFEAVPVTIPSFFRPTLMKSAGSSVAGNYVPMDPAWATDNPLLNGFARRSFRPHPAHLVRDQEFGNIANRYLLTPAEATAAGLISGPFPFFPANSGSGNENPLVFGECGIWTGSSPVVIELDVDNDQFDEIDTDGSVIKTNEGIWLDLHYPLQEHVDSGGNVRTYVALHSFTIYDLDALINVNVHGNINNLARTGNIPGEVTAGSFASQMLSASHLGTGPHEINPLYALRRNTLPLGAAVAFDTQIPPSENEEFNSHYGQTPTTPVEQANMEWYWLLTGRADFNAGNIDDILPGRWGDIQSLYFALNNGGNVAHYPRPGRSDGQTNTVTSGNGVRYGGGFGTDGNGGYDDNQDRYEGEAVKALNRRRPFGQPLDVAGTGRRTTHDVAGFVPATGEAVPVPATNPLTRLMNITNIPAAWPMYDGYNVVREIPTAVGAGGPIHYSQRYLFGMNQTLDNGIGDDLMSNPFFDALFEDPLETIFDSDLAQRPLDNIFGPQDTFAMHMTAGDIAGALEPPTSRLSDLAPWALAQSSRNREMLTTYSYGYRYVPFRNPFGNDGRPGQRGVDDDGDGVIDNASEVLVSVNLNTDANPDNDIDADSAWRWQEWTADTDGPDRHGLLVGDPPDGYPDGDGNLEFPPAFWNDQDADGVRDPGETIRPYSALDPFRPQARRTIQAEAGDNTALIGQLMLSINHLVDVDRQWDDLGPDGMPNTGDEQSIVPPEGTPEFLYYMQSSGLRFRPLTEHPHFDETNVTSETNVYSLELVPDANAYTVPEAVNVKFPPDLPSEREFWARRDRQQLARDIFVLLYTLGGGRLDANGLPMDFTASNDPGLAENFEDPANPGLTPPAPAPNALYTHEQVRRMAQFAVNMVDAMDTDDVVTKFEYDKDLGNGWNLDDDPYTVDIASITLPAAPTPNEKTRYNEVTAGGLYPEDSGVIDTGDADGDGDTTDVIDFDRGVVFGVEKQELVFNEVFAVRSPQLVGDHAATMHDDTGSPHDFLQIELQNVTPLNVNLGPDAVNKDNCIWRIARFDRETGVVATDDPVATANDFDRAIVLLKDAMPASEIPAGTRLTISTGSPDLQAGAGLLNASDFYVDYDSTNGYAAPQTWERIAPDIDAATNNPSTISPGCDIDLHFDDHLTTNMVARVLGDDSSPLTDGPVDPNKGAFLETLTPYAGNDTFGKATHGASGYYGSTGSAGFDLVLQRRVNPHMPNLTQDANPWVEMDRIHVTFTPFGLVAATNTTTDVQNFLTTLGSRERSQPLNYAHATHSSTPKPNHRYNTITNDNSNGVAMWLLAQDHFDRDFASTAELLELPLYGQSLLTQRLGWSMRNPLDQSHDQTRGTDPTTLTDPDVNPSYLSTAASLFLAPDFVDIPVVTSPADDLTNNARDNRWYRILQFIEVPSRVHRMLGNYLAQNRVPGKLNLNTIRHREVFAGLIDDPFLMDLAVGPELTPYYTGAPGSDPGNSFPDGSFTHPAGAPGGTDRWRHFLQQRDGLRPGYDSGTATSLPGPMKFWAPGIPGASPFRTFTNDEGNGIEDSVLRQLRTDRALPAVNRLWTEVGTVADHQGTSAIGAIATMADRQQLLPKILNNTTTVSNTFIVFGTAGFFEAVENPNGLVQVGGAYDVDGSGSTTDDHKRAVFLIDRTEALNAFDPGSGDFDWKRLIKARLDIQ